ncbi:MAG: hypothetical protein H0X13_00390 [Ramlibacter sp.]|nr:hypothetical protein [Ramlibacter sp.]
MTVTPTPSVTGRATLLARLLHHFSPVELDAVTKLGDRLIAAAGGVEKIAAYKVMVAYGGGKDSSYTVAFLRAVQLQVLERHGQAFRLRVANMRHAGVAYAVMANIDRVYQALSMYGDPSVELLVVDHDLVRPFERDLPFPEHVREMNRFDVLMNGHRTAGDGRPTFCNSCNLAVADFYGRAAWWDGGVDAVMTGDSRKEQKHYFTWIMRLAKQVGLDTEECRRHGFRGLLTALNGVGQHYYTELFGAGFDQDKASRRIASGDADSDPAFISIYDLVSYRVEDHWELLTGFLGFRFEELAFSFTESDCANPVLMAHFRGLKTEYVRGRTYGDGIREYLELAEALMRKKEIPQRLIDLAMSAYADSGKIRARRELAAAYARDAFGLDEEQLVCMQFAPFVDAGQELQTYVAARHLQRRAALPLLHEVLAAEAENVEAAAWLECVSGLPLAALRNLYRNTRVNFETQDTLISRVRANDPHKRRILTIHAQTGEPVAELMSGR